MLKQLKKLAKYLKSKEIDVLISYASEKLKVGDFVKVENGKYQGMIAEITGINYNTKIVYAKIDMFGRQVPVSGPFSDFGTFNFYEPEEEFEISDDEEINKIIKELNNIHISPGQYNSTENTTKYTEKLFELSKYLNQMNDQQVSVFEKHLKIASSLTLQHTSFIKFYLPILKANPEYINTNLLSANFLQSLLINIDYATSSSSSIDTSLFSDSFLCQIYNSIANPRDFGFFEIFAYIYKTLWEKFPMLTERLYYDLIKYDPYVYFGYNLGNFFKKDKNGNGPPEIPIQEIVKMMAKSNPIDLLKSNILNSPEIEKDPEFINLESTLVKKLIQNIDGVLFFFNNGYYEKYPFLEPMFKNKVFEYNYVGFNETFLNSDYGSKLLEQLAYKMVDEYQLFPFFQNELDKKFESFARIAIQKVIEKNDKNLFYQLGLNENPKYKAMAEKAGWKMKEEYVYQSRVESKLD